MKPLSCRCLAKSNPNPESQPVISTALLPICKTKQNKMHWNWVFKIGDLQHTEVMSLARSSLFQGVLYTHCQLLPPSASWTQEMTFPYRVHSSEAASLPFQHRGVQHLWKRPSKATRPSKQPCSGSSYPSWNLKIYQIVPKRYPPFIRSCSYTSKAGRSPLLCACSP